MTIGKQGVPQRFENPMLAVDVVALRLIERGLTIGVAPRHFEPCKGELALPGVLMVTGETVLDAASRALQTKLGVGSGGVGFLGKGRVYDTPDRDERGPTVSVGCVAVVYDAGDRGTVWVPTTGVPPLPFDHNAIVQATLEDILRDLWLDRDLLKALLGETFTTVDAAAVVQLLSGAVPYGSTLRRQLANAQFLEARAAAPTSGRGRPPTAWGFKH